MEISVEYQKNDIVLLTIEDIGNDGEGIGKVDGYTLFVKDAVIGDVVEARITKCKKNYGYARVEKVATPSSFRTEPKCRYYRQCGGCQIQAVRYERQLVYKQNKVRNHLLRIGGFCPEQIDAITEPIVGMEEPWHYRNKAQYPVGYDRNGNIITGFYAGRTHDIVANTDCPLGVEENKQILEAVLDYMKEYQVSAYDEKNGKGLVRHILIRTGFASGEMMVCLIINGKKLPAEEKLTEKLLRLDLTGNDAGTVQAAVKKKIVSLCVSVNTEQTNVIMGKEIRTLWGREYIEDSIRILEEERTSGTPAAFAPTEERVTFRISPLSFYQVNPKQTEKLYSIALAYAGLTGRETVWDLYCGIGTISLLLAKKAKQVYGVEVIPQAIRDARENGAINGIANAEFYVGKAEDVLPAFYEKAAEAQKKEKGNQEKLHPDVIVVDPPRKGCDEKCLDTMLKMRPERIVYVSCDSATLARDLRILCGGGYELKKIRCVDQFGQSVHVETVVQLSKGEINSKKVRVEFSLEDMDMSGFQKGATYGQIKDYVKEHTGLSVSSLYIAQVKQKYGIIERENYNKPKSENTRQPQCPPEKEAAITEALKHFRMI
ncbi:MAG: 23S rRNA (uracil(1939)-C(5))-methyltransferase RlmD [Clostridiales bacterium]|nr:23S rRNA (uracil(1939)-C(5))-methyltransferase RlmD [Clostridiales bacterium]